MKKNLVVAGMPRCGTTYLFRCLMGLPPGAGSPKGASLKALPGIKCHSLAPPEKFDTDPWASDVEECINNGGRAIFVFGDPLAAVVSTKRNRFDIVHARNCGCNSLASLNLFSRDAFNYERMFDSWVHGKHSFPVLALRYETMPQHLNEIEMFVGRKVSWNQWLNRRTSPREQLHSNHYDLLARTYRSLSKKVKDASDCMLIG